MYKSHLLGCSFEVKGLPTPTTRNGGVNQRKLHYHTDRQRGKIHREGVSVPVLQVSYQTLPVTMEQNTHCISHHWHSVLCLPSKAAHPETITDNWSFSSAVFTAISSFLFLSI